MAVGIRPHPNPLSRGEGIAGIAAQDVSVSLGGNPVLRGVSFAARPGEVAGLIGPNGAGKSTLLRALAGLLRPDSGEVQLGDTPLKTLNAGQRARRIAFMPQHDAMHPFTALETVLMGRYAHLGRFELEGREDRQIAREAMTRTDTAQFESRQLDRLSGGERQRVILARALAQQAGIILLDEPFGQPRPAPPALDDGDAAGGGGQPQRGSGRGAARRIAGGPLLRPPDAAVGRRHRRGRQARRRADSLQPADGVRRGDGGAGGPGHRQPPSLAHRPGAVTQYPLPLEGEG